MEELELLAPAGNAVSLRAAVENGADAVYMGLDNFNARKMTENFDLEKYKEAIAYAHKRNVKVYLTMNTLLYNYELEEAVKSVIALYQSGLDGVIVQDLGLAKLLHKVIPELSLHASTQMTVHNLKQVKFLESIGFKRVVLARELTVKEIEYICKNTDLEIEVFVHGALCVSFSGQCLLSSMIGKRSGNRGSCAQPCRTKYSLCYKDSKNKILSGMNLLSKKDIYGICHIQRLAKAGVKSLKIEGRNKVPEYVATVVSKYRKQIDNAKISKEDEKELLQIFNRSGKSYGYLEKVENNPNSISTETAKNTGLVLGKVLDVKNKFIKIKLNENINLHDGVEVHGKNNVASTIVTCIRNSEYKIINKEVEKGTEVWIGDFNASVSKGDKVYKTSSKELNERLKHTYDTEKSFNKKTNIIVNVSIKKEKNMYAVACTKDKSKVAECIIEYIPSEAKTVAITKENVIEKFTKLKDTVFNVDKIEIELDNDLYVPVSKLNELRRTLYTKLEEQYVENIDVTKCYEVLEKELSKLNKLSNTNNVKNKKISRDAAYIYKFDKQKDYSNIATNYSRVYIEVEDFIKYEKDIIVEFAANDIYISLPNVILERLEKYIDKNLERLLSSYVNIRGIVISNIAYLERIKVLKAQYDLEVVADYQMNVTNFMTAESLKEYGVDKFCIMPDLENDIVEEFIKVYNVEILKNYVTVMTSRYCVLGSFLSKSKEKCEMPCQKGEYVLKDFKNENLYIVSRPLDCVMRLVKDLSETKYNKQVTYVNKRDCIL